MACQHFTGASNRLMTAVTAGVWRVAGMIGPVIMPRIRDLTLLFAGTLPDIAVAIVNSVILPLVTKKRGKNSSA